MFGNLIEYFFPTQGAIIDYEYQLNQAWPAALGLSYENPVAPINLGLSEQDQQMLDAFHIAPEKFGDQNSIIFDGISQNPDLMNSYEIVYNLLESYSHNNDTVLGHITDLVLNIHNELVLNIHEEYQASLNVTLAFNGEIDWQTDGHPDDYVFIATLKGPNNLFYIPSDEMNDKFGNIIAGYKYASYGNVDLSKDLNTINSGRVEIDNLFFASNVYSPPHGYGTMHLAGDTNKGAIFSSPNFNNEERLTLVMKINREHEPKCWLPSEHLPKQTLEYYYLAYIPVFFSPLLMPFIYGLPIFIMEM